MERTERYTIKRAFGLFFIVRQVKSATTGKWLDLNDIGSSHYSRETAKAEITRLKNRDKARAAATKAADFSCPDCGRLYTTEQADAAGSSCTHCGGTLEGSN